MLSNESQREKVEEWKKTWENAAVKQVPTSHPQLAFRYHSSGEGQS